MGRALVLDSSSRTLGSASRALTEVFRNQFSACHDEADLVYRDLVATAVPHLSADMIEGFFAPEPSVRAKRATVLSDQLIDEFMAADVICIGVSIYNFNVPSCLKAYIDQIVRIGRTFQKHGDGHLEGLCKGKKLLVLYAMGGVFQGTERDFIKPYFELLADFMGIKQCDFIAIEGTSRKGFSLEEQLQRVTPQLQEYVATLTPETEHA